MYEDQLSLPLLHTYKHIVAFNGSIYIQETQYYRLLSELQANIVKPAELTLRLMALPWQGLLHLSRSASNRGNVCSLKKLLTQLVAGNDGNIRGYSYTDTSSTIHVDA